MNNVVAEKMTKYCHKETLYGIIVKLNDGKGFVRVADIFAEAGTLSYFTPKEDELQSEYLSHLLKELLDEGRILNSGKRTACIELAE
ncbi:MAG TPA: hypothetical protein VJB11_02880 [archaeon]|nr:hypothetical protein [archaeon]